MNKFILQIDSIKWLTCRNFQHQMSPEISGCTWWRKKCGDRSRKHTFTSYNVVDWLLKSSGFLYFSILYKNGAAVTNIQDLIIQVNTWTAEMLSLIHISKTFDNHTECKYKLNCRLLKRKWQRLMSLLLQKNNAHFHSTM